MRAKLAFFPVFLSLLVSPGALLRAAENGQTVNVTDKLQIPGATLKSGTYTFSVEDRLADRSIVRITSQSGDQHYLLLTVPNRKLSADSSSQLSYFTTKEDKKNALRAWKCPDCSSPLEFVYPKLEAVKITDESTQPVLAVDPTYDKLPANLSADDMKVVTLWLLAPERITADNVGKGVKAAKYLGESNTNNAETASASAPTAPETPTVPETPTAAATPAPAVSSVPAPGVTEVASNSMPHVPHRQHLPKTGSDTGLLLLCGLAALTGAGLLHMRRTRGRLQS